MQLKFIDLKVYVDLVRLGSYIDNLEYLNKFMKQMPLFSSLVLDIRYGYGMGNNLDYMKKFS